MKEGYFTPDLTHVTLRLVELVAIFLLGLALLNLGGFVGVILGIFVAVVGQCNSIPSFLSDLIIHFQMGPA